MEYKTGKSNPIDGPSRRLDYKVIKEGIKDNSNLLPTLYNKLRLTAVI